MSRSFARKVFVESLHAQVVLAHKGLDLSNDFLENLKNSKSDETADFRLAQVVRILYLYRRSNPDYPDRIKLLGAIHPSNLNYWLQKGEEHHVYWTENHMILWLSSAWLMKQLKGWEMDSELDKRLHHYLDLKLNYGFYEFFSATYLPYTFSALMNLADFSENREIQSKAELAAKRLLKELLMVTTDKGVSSLPGVEHIQTPTLELMVGMKMRSYTFLLGKGSR